MKHITRGLFAGLLLLPLSPAPCAFGFAGPLGGEAVVVDVLGHVSAQVMEGSAHTTKFPRQFALHRNASVGRMSQITTGRNGQVYLLFSTGVLVGVGPNSSIAIEQLRHTSLGLPRREEDLVRQLHIRLHRGQIQVFGGPPKATLDLRILTPDGMVAANGGVFSVAQLPGGDWGVFNDSGEQRIVTDRGETLPVVDRGVGRLGRGDDGQSVARLDASLADSGLRAVPGTLALYQDVAPFMDSPSQFDRQALGGYLGGEGQEIVFLGGDVQISDVSPSFRPVSRSHQLRVPAEPGRPTGGGAVPPGMLPRWNGEQAWRWYNAQGIIKGGNYVPRYAVNSIEMWQADRFDADMIREELGWARDAGYTSMRVQLQAAVWQNDPDGFMARFETFLAIAQENGLRVAPVLFDDLNLAGVEPSVGPQPDPVPGKHNAHWLPSPGRSQVVNENRWPELEAFVRAVIGTYGDDPRILFWDMYNMAGAGASPEESLPFMSASMRWARDMEPEQPIAVAVWSRLASAMSAHMLELSDIITFQSFDPPDEVEALLGYLARFERPLVCTGWLMRQRGNDFENILPLFSRYGVGWFNNGFANGRTQKWIQQASYRSEENPDLWQHDILKEDGTPYRQEEIDAIRAFRFVAD